MKKNYFLIIIAILIVVSALILRIRQVDNRVDSEQNNNVINSGQNQAGDSATNTDNLVGSDRDEHGCIASAGYTWCEPKEKCIRSWEESCDLEGLEEEVSQGNNETASSTPIVTSPLPGETVSSPLEISGEAKGTWFFEAIIPLRLEDANNNVIAEGYGEAQGNWMTENFVPFSATINYTTQASSGYLVIIKNNPSGLPQYDDQMLIPINF